MHLYAQDNQMRPSGCSHILFFLLGSNIGSVDRVCSRRIRVAVIELAHRARGVWPVPNEWSLRLGRFSEREQPLAVGGSLCAGSSERKGHGHVGESRPAAYSVSRTSTAERHTV